MPTRPGADTHSEAPALTRREAHLQPAPSRARAGVGVRLHMLANPRFNRAVQHLPDYLNATESN